MEFWQPVEQDPLAWSREEQSADSEIFFSRGLSAYIMTRYRLLLRLDRLW